MAIKRKFFEQVTSEALGKWAIEDLEKGRHLRLGRTDMIHSACEEIFGDSFKTRSEEDYDHIEDMFRCRNTIVHCGDLTFKDKHSKMHDATVDTYEQWMESARVMLKWLRRLRL